MLSYIIVIILGYLLAYFICLPYWLNHLHHHHNDN